MNPRKRVKEAENPTERKTERRTAVFLVEKAGYDLGGPSKHRKQ